MDVKRWAIVALLCAACGQRGPHVVEAYEPDEATVYIDAPDEKGRFQWELVPVGTRFRLIDERPDKDGKHRAYCQEGKYKDETVKLWAGKFRDAH